LSRIQGAVCQHPIADVALRKVGGGYLVECHGCASALGVVTDPREFQALRRANLALVAMPHTGFRDGAFRH
jgi:hypothetical protein